MRCDRIWRNARLATMAGSPADDGLGLVDDGLIACGAGRILYEGAVPVFVDIDARTVTRCGNPLTLTPKAYELLLALVRRNGAVAPRNDLLKEVWGYGALIMTRTVDTHIAELRRKIEKNPAEPEHIVTVWKVGYRLASPGREG